MNKWDLETEIFNVGQPKTVNMLEIENERLQKHNKELLQRIAKLEAGQNY